MIEEKIIFNKQQIIDFYKSHKLILGLEDAEKSFSEFLYNIDWQIVQIDSWISKLIDQNLEIEIPISFHNFNNLYKIDKKILLDHCENHPEQNILNLLSNLLANNKCALNYYDLYFEAIKNKQINPLDNDTSLNIFANTVIEIFFYKVDKLFPSEKEKETLEEIQHLALIQLFDYIKEENVRKLSFCQFIENVEINFKNKEVKEIIENYTPEDFREYKKNYNNIKNFYEGLDNELTEKELLTTSLQFNLALTAKLLEMDLEEYKKGFSQCNSYMKLQAKKLIDIENVLEFDSKTTFINYISYSKKTEEVELFIKKYKKFMEIVPSEKALNIFTNSFLDEQWNNVSMFINMDNKTPIKKIEKKKKV